MVEEEPKLDVDHGPAPRGHGGIPVGPRRRRTQLDQRAPVPRLPGPNPPSKRFVGAGETLSSSRDLQRSQWIFACYLRMLLGNLREYRMRPKDGSPIRAVVPTRTEFTGQRPLAQMHQMMDVGRIDPRRRIGHWLATKEGGRVPRERRHMRVALVQTAACQLQQPAGHRCKVLSTSPDL